MGACARLYGSGRACASLRIRLWLAKSIAFKAGWWARARAPTDQDACARLYGSGYGLLKALRLRLGGGREHAPLQIRARVRVSTNQGACARLYKSGRACASLWIRLWLAKSIAFKARWWARARAPTNQGARARLYKSGQEHAVLAGVTRWRIKNPEGCPRGCQQ